MRQWQNHRTNGNTVEPPVSQHPKCKDLVVAYGKWSLTGGGRLREVVALTRIEQQGVFSEKRSGHIYFVEDNLLQAISKLRHVQFHVVTKFFVHVVLLFNQCI